MTIKHNGNIIRKASSDSKDEKAQTFKRRLITAIMFVCGGIFVLNFFLRLNDIVRRNAESEVDPFIIKSLFIGCIGFLIFICIYIKLQEKPKRYAFIKSPYGEMYIIDYNTPLLANNPYDIHMGRGRNPQFDPLFLDKDKSAAQIDMINRMHIFEALADRNMVMPFGKKILCVRSIKNIELGRYLTLTTTDGQHAPSETRIFLPHTYPDLDELLMHLEPLTTVKL